MKTIKFLKLAFIAICITSLFAACTKDKDNTPTLPMNKNAAIQGNWNGSFTNNGTGSATPAQYSLIIRENGTLEVRTAGAADTTPAAATGTWSLVGNTFNATYVGSGTEGGVPTASIIGTYDSGAGTITGNFGSTSNTGGGTFTMTKNKTASK